MVQCPTNDDDLLRVRMQPQSQVDGFSVGVQNSEAGKPGSLLKCGCREMSGSDENNRTVREQIIAVFEKELKRRIGIGNDDVDGAVCILLLQIIVKQLRLVFPRKSIGFQV